ncbi:hypothetical protein ACSDQ9_05715 [Aestuariimicrobium soli]|uniref:hypothetical protein n=1 Tax=Aestuariimicrobium soli TaxID=2035834 RepID=UPI003EBE06DD
MSETVLTPPASETFGFVTGKVVRSRGDRTGDVDTKPDFIAATGTVEFTPLELESRRGDAVVIRDAIVCTVDATTGILTDEAGRAEVWLWVGAWRVRFRPDKGTLAPFDINVQASHTEAAPLDLATAAPYSPGPGVMLASVPIPSGGVAGQVLPIDGAGGLTLTNPNRLEPVTADTAAPAAATLVGLLRGYWNVTPATSLTIAGETVPATGWLIIGWNGTAWVPVGSGSAELPPPPPTAAGTLTASPTSTTALLTVAGHLNVTEFAYSKDGGTTWSAWQSAASYTFTGLTASTSYTFRHKARGADMVEKLGATVTVSTQAAGGWVVKYGDDFTAADGTAVVGRALPQGTGTWALAASQRINTTTIQGNKATTSATTSGQDSYVQMWSTFASAKRKLRVTATVTPSSDNKLPSIGISTTGSAVKLEFVGTSLQMGSDSPSPTSQINVYDMASTLLTGNRVVATGVTTSAAHTLILEFDSNALTGSVWLDGTQRATIGPKDGSQVGINVVGSWWYMYGTSLTNLGGVDSFVLEEWV